jgi:hypothetical protein
MSALKEDLAGSRQLRFRVDGKTLHVFKRKGESTHQVYLKVALLALYRSAYPDLELDPRIDCKYQPHVAMVDYTGEVRFWGQVGKLPVDPLAYVLKHTDADEVVIAGDDIDLPDTVAYYKRHLHYRYTTGKLRICVFRPLDEWFNPDDVELSPDDYEIHQF